MSELNDFFRITCNFPWQYITGSNLCGDIGIVAAAMQYLRMEMS